MMSLRKKTPPLFGRDIPPDCAYCDYNASAPERPVCRLGLKRPENGKCARYRYNPLLREPKTPPPLPEHDPEEFKL